MSDFLAINVQLRRDFQPQAIKAACPYTVEVTSYQDTLRIQPH